MLAQAGLLIGHAENIHDMPVIGPRSGHAGQRFNGRGTAPGIGQSRAVRQLKVDILREKRHGLTCHGSGALGLSQIAQNAGQLDRRFPVARIELMGLGPECGLCQQVLAADGFALGGTGRNNGGALRQIISERLLLICPRCRASCQQRDGGHQRDFRQGPHGRSPLPSESEVYSSLRRSRLR